MYFSLNKATVILALILLFFGSARSQEEKEQPDSETVVLADVVPDRNGLTALAKKIKEAIKTDVSPEAQAWQGEPKFEEIHISSVLNLVWLSQPTGPDTNRQTRAEVTVTKWVSPEKALKRLDSAAMSPAIGMFKNLSGIGDKAYIYEPGGGAICFVKGSFLVSIRSSQSGAAYFTRLVAGQL